MKLKALPMSKENKLNRVKRIFRAWQQETDRPVLDAQDTGKTENKAVPFKHKNKIAAGPELDQSGLYKEAHNTFKFLTSGHQKSVLPLRTQKESWRLRLPRILNHNPGDHTW